jgi:bifunctional DNA-binding transcriptional regulator/antitoxin component of YhaV-PrlF toxin-antitoxin module
MTTAISTITSKWQVTIPEEVRKDLPFKVGQKISWEIEGDKLVGRRIRSISELAGCLKSGALPADSDDDQGAFDNAVLARYDRISRQKP